MTTQNKTKRLLITLSLLAAFVLIPAAMATAATITTDQEDYAPWEIVTLTGTGFAPNATVDMLITWPDGYPDLITGILTDASGGFIYVYEKEKFSGTYTVEASDGVNIAATTFTDAMSIKVLLSAVQYQASPGKDFGDIEQGTDLSYTADIQVSGMGSGNSVDWRLRYAGSSETPLNNAVLSGETTGLPATGTHTSSSQLSHVTVTIQTNDLTSGTTYSGHLICERTGGSAASSGGFYFQFRVTTPPPASDTVKPASSATSPASSSSATFTVSYTASDSGTPTSGLASVELWAKGPTDSAFAKFGTDTIAAAPASASGSFSYTATQGNGVYLFYTIAKDVAGNTEDAPASEDDSTLVTIDASAPVVTASVPTPDGLNGWFVTKPVTVTITADDSSNVTAILVNGDAVNASDITGLGTTHAVATLSISAEGTTSIVATATDGLGNTGAGPGSDNSAAVKIDTIAPTLIKDLAGTTGTNGWFKSDVTVTLTGDDPTPGSGLNRVEYKINDGSWGTYDAPFTISDEGITTLSHRAYDNAGNVFELAAQEIKIDKTAPTVTITTPSEGADYLLNENVLASWMAEDPEPPEPAPGPASGLFSATGTTANGAPIDTATVGEKTYTVTAVDNAGNSTTVTRTYYVRFRFIGFLPPVNNLPDKNVGKAGRTYPIKWQLTDANGNFIRDLSVVKYNPLRYYQTQALGTDPSEINYVDGDTSGATMLRYDLTSEQYIFNWQTSKSMAGNWYKVVLELTDGSTHVALFSLTK